jgi:hypothetical protein
MRDWEHYDPSRMFPMQKLTTQRPAPASIFADDRSPQHHDVPVIPASQGKFSEDTRNNQLPASFSTD